MPFPEPTLKKFGESVRAHRVAQDLSQEQRADLDRTRQHIGPSDSLLILEDNRAMVVQKLRRRLSDHLWPTNRPTFKRPEALLQCRLGKIRLQSLAQNDRQLAIKCDEAGVKRCIVQTGKAEPVSGIESLSVGGLAPRLDMAGHKQSRDIDARYAAIHPVGIEDTLPEQLLTTTLVPPYRDISRSNMRCDGARRLKFYLLPRKEIYFPFIVFGEEIVQHLLTLRSQNRELGLKGVPHSFVLRRRPGKPFPAAGLNHRIKRSKVTKFHGQTVRCSTHLIRHLHDEGIPFVQFPKGQFAVEVQSDEKMLAGPNYTRGFSHAPRQTVPQHHAKPRNVLLGPLRSHAK